MSRVGCWPFLTAKRYHSPIFSIDCHGSCSGSASPDCNNSIEIPSGERMKRHAAIAGWAVKSHAFIQELLAGRINIVDLIRQMPESCARHRRSRESQL